MTFVEVLDRIQGSGSVELDLGYDESHARDRRVGGRRRAGKGVGERERRDLIALLAAVG
jgi:hypothetical protein